MVCGLFWTRIDLDLKILMPNLLTCATSKPGNRPDTAARKLDNGGEFWLLFVRVKDLKDFEVKTTEVCRVEVAFSIKEK